MLRIDFTKKTQNTTVKSYSDMKSDVIKVQTLSPVFRSVSKSKSEVPCRGASASCSGSSSAAFLLLRAF